MYYYKSEKSQMGNYILNFVKKNLTTTNEFVFAFT